MNESLKTKCVKLIRWIFVLPSAFFGGLTALLVAHLFCWLIYSLTNGEAIWPQFLYQLVKDFIGALFAGFCFVKLGVYVAPTFKKTISVILGVLIFVIFVWKFLGWSLMLTFAPGYFLEETASLTWRQIFVFSGLALGAFFSIKNVFTGEYNILDFEQY